MKNAMSVSSSAVVEATTRGICVPRWQALANPSLKRTRAGMPLQALISFWALPRTTSNTPSPPAAARHPERSAESGRCEPKGEQPATELLPRSAATTGAERRQVALAFVFCVAQRLS